MSAHVEIGGLLRCCMEAVPCDADGYAIAGKAGDAHVCPATPERADSGVRWSVERNAWIAAWRKE